MAYSHSRLRKTLAVVRVITGVVFVSMGAFKVSSLEFDRMFFPEFLDSAVAGGAVTWFRPVVAWISSFGPVRIGVALGFVELFIGIALILGLAVRPASLVGMIYMGALFLATFNQTASVSLMQSAEHQFRNLFPFLVLLMLGVGHAGETWGVGGLYHHHRSRMWAGNVPEVTTPPVRTRLAEPGSFDELLEEDEIGQVDLEAASLVNTPEEKDV